ncbi:hypothetical protein MMC20_007720 [Loxospora ochrophaea]|nr:hypothetical protein [Loxospora ochrophaea]
MSSPFCSERLLYRAVEDFDLPILHALWSNPEIYANTQLALLKPTSEKDSQNSLALYRESCLLCVVICLLPDPFSPPSTQPPTPVGRMSLWPSSPKHTHHRNASIGLEILPQHQNCGYGTEAIRWTLDWGFKTAGLHRIEIGCFSYNQGAQRLYPRLGFTFEARRREALWFDGGWHDLVEFSMLEGEWPEKRKQLQEQQQQQQQLQQVDV